MKRLASIICFVYSFVYIAIMTSSDDVTGANDVFLSIVIGLVFGGFGYWFWPKKFNSLIQFGYSYELLEDLAELDFLKSKIEEFPHFNIWVGDYNVIAYNDNLIEDKFAVAQLKQFTKQQLKQLRPKSNLKYHSFDKQGIWFEVITDSKIKRIKKKPYPFQ